jgi:hypothetical protein
MEYLKGYSQSVGLLSESNKQGFWQIWEEDASDELSFVLGFKVDVDPAKAPDEQGADTNSPLLAAKDLVISQAPDTNRDMVESWNLASSELWYFLRAMQRRRRSERAELLRGIAF